MGIDTIKDHEAVDELVRVARQYGAVLSWPESYSTPEAVLRRVNIQMPASKAQAQAGRDGDCGIFDNVTSALEFIRNWVTRQQLRHEVTNKEIKAYVKEKLSTNDAWAQKALLLIMAHQLPDEQNADRTVYVNHIGFTGFDAPLLTSFAKQLRDRKFLSTKQMAILRKTIAKYWQQVIDASDEVKLLTQVKAARRVEQTRLAL
jgi:hypothetical protein